MLGLVWLALVKEGLGFGLGSGRKCFDLSRAFTVLGDGRGIVVDIAYQSMTVKDHSAWKTSTERCSV